MLLLIGGVVGFFFGTVLGATLIAAAVGALAILGPLGLAIGPIVALIGPLLGPLSVPIAILVGALCYLVITVLAYALESISVLGLAPAAGPLPTIPFELFMRGFTIGVTASANFFLWVGISGNPGIAGIFALINLLATIPGVSGNRFVYQRILGFTSWLLPMSYLVTPVGVLLFVLNLPFALAASGFAALRFDFLTATFETSGGALVNFLFALGATGAGGFNLGNFTFLRLPAGAPPASVQTPFAGPGLSAHETGHTLTIAAFGGFHGWINAVDENVAPLARGPLALGELIANSHFGGTGGPFIAVW